MIHFRGLGAVHMDFDKHVEKNVKQALLKRAELRPFILIKGINNETCLINLINPNVLMC